MKLDEVIKHYEETVIEKIEEYQECLAVHDMENAEECGRYGEQCEQLVKWLKDYKRLLEQEPTTKNDLAVDCIDRAQAQTEIELNASRYTLAKERGSMGKIEWGGLLIKVGEAVDIIRSLPSVTPTRKQEPIIDKIRAEIDQYLFQNEFGSEYRKEVSQIIDKYRESEE